MKGIEEFLSHTVDVEKLLDVIPFDDADIVQASINQPLLFLEASRLRVQALRVRVAAEARLTSMRSHKSLRIRAEAARTGVKCTEGSIKEQVDVSPACLRCQAELDEALVREEFTKLLLESLRQRRDAIEVIQRVNSSEYGVLRGAVDSAIKVSDIRAKASGKYPGKQ